MADDSEDNLLQAALSSAFSPGSLPVAVIAQSSRQSAHSQPQPMATEEEKPPVSEGDSVNEQWKIEYEAHANAWRAQSAEARARAEKERDRWEAIRAAEKKESKPVIEKEVAEQHHEVGWETLPETSSTTDNSISLPQTPSPAGGGDVATGEHAGQTTSANISPKFRTLKPPQSVLSGQETGDESQKWENVSSPLTSSLPSMTFPEHANTPPLRTGPQDPPPVLPPLSATMSVFDTSLPPRSRALALLSSLAINMVLPFINGVMLGFGEIFAKNVILGWLGWQPGAPTRSTTTVGLGRTSLRRESKTVPKGL